MNQTNKGKRQRAPRGSYPAGQGAGNVKISQPTDDTQFTAGVANSANGTYAISSNYHVTSVCVIYTDDTGTPQRISCTVNQPQPPDGTWSTSFTLPKANWEYILSARAANAGGTTDYWDVFITTAP